MKQHITSEQLAELTEGQKDRLFEWELVSTQKKLNKDLPGAIYVQWRNDKNLPLISIGQMIEFLSEQYFDMSIKMRGVGNETFYYLEHDKMSKEIGFYSDTELADLLWFAVKEVLEAKREVGV